MRINNDANNDVDDYIGANDDEDNYVGTNDDAGDYVGTSDDASDRWCPWHEVALTFNYKWWFTMMLTNSTWIMYMINIYCFICLLFIYNL